MRPSSRHAASPRSDRRAATGAKTSRPWNVSEAPLEQLRILDLARLRARDIERALEHAVVRARRRTARPRAPRAGGARCRRPGRRPRGTPCPAGTTRARAPSTNAARAISPGRDLVRDVDQRRRPARAESSTPFISATYQSAPPKSVRSTSGPHGNRRVQRAAHDVAHPVGRDRAQAREVVALVAVAGRAPHARVDRAVAVLLAVGEEALGLVAAEDADRRRAHRDRDVHRARVAGDERAAERTCAAKRAQPAPVTAKARGLSTLARDAVRRAPPRPGPPNTSSASRGVLGEQRAARARRSPRAPSAASASARPGACRAARASAGTPSVGEVGARRGLLARRVSVELRRRVRRVPAERLERGEVEAHRALLRRARRARCRPRCAASCSGSRRASGAAVAAVQIAVRGLQNRSSTTSNRARWSSAHRRAVAMAGRLARDRPQPGQPGVAGQQGGAVLLGQVVEGSAWGAISLSPGQDRRGQAEVPDEARADDEDLANGRRGRPGCGLTVGA